MLLPLIDIQVHPSHMEGVPLSICSGMAAGLPIVASDVGGIKEVITSGRTGILVPENDTPQFIKAVVDLIGSSSERARLGGAAKNFIEHEYSLAKAVQDLQNSYLEVL